MADRVRPKRYACRRCNVTLTLNFDHVSSTCPDRCGGTFQHPFVGTCELRGHDVGHADAWWRPPA